MVIVLYGDIGSGFAACGPFADHEAAQRWAERHVRIAAWWVVDLEEP